ncbi:MAG: DUF2298 domain-containing protein [Ruminococcus sp.]|jgi:uncharacterized membrane protein
MDTCFIWWAVILVLGASFMPMSKMLFRDFRDGGWLFSKVLGVAVPGFLVWVLVCCGILPFQPAACIGVALFCIIVNIGIFWYRIKKGKSVFWLTRDNGILILGEEILFLLLFLGWTYLAGFHAAAYGTEKFMDYGFMASMMRSETLPAPDIWYAGEAINYYYGGQYFAVFLTKMTFTRIQETYHVMRTLVAALAFVLPFALVRQIWEDRTTAGKRRARAAVPAGVLAGMAVSMAGNMHYVLAAHLLKWFRGFLGHDSDYTYWFPNSTRYIGYYPEGNDKTIHEFPAYSFVLGDLHAHVVNLMFVLLLLGMIYAYMKRPLITAGERKSMGMWERIKKDFLQVHLVMFALLTGIFHFTNYWDFAIYFVVIMAVIVYRNLREGGFSWRYTVIKSAVQGIWLFLLSSLAALPFTASFKTMVSGIALAQNHSSIKQLLVVWGLPFVMCIVFLVWMIRAAVKNRGNLGRFQSVFCRLHFQDLYIGGLALCAIGLVLVPEIIYVRDIYEEGYARANTMFKLTYQAFTLFGICMAYILVRFLLHRSRGLYITGIVTGICLVSTFGYIINAGSAWYGSDLSLEAFPGLDATAYLAEDFPEDADAIAWLNENVEGSPVIVEACGDSYSDYERVSAMTGLPCVMGWYVHEWLWRGDVEALNERRDDVEKIYTSEDEETVKNLLDKYDVKYLYVGSLEREKYGVLDDEMLRSLGDVVFEKNNTYIIEISR